MAFTCHPATEDRFERGEYVRELTRRPVAPGVLAYDGLHGRRAKLARVLDTLGAPAHGMV